MDKLIFCLTAIYNFAKDIHYSAHGQAFYSKHELADRIANNMNDYIDRIKETILLADDIAPKSSKEYLQGAIGLIPDRELADDIENFSRLKILMIETLSHIEDLTQTEDLTHGSQNLIDEIASDIQSNLGLVNLQIKEG